MADARFASLQGRKYLNIETFRKSGQGVRTPVWFAGEPDDDAPEKVYVYSTSDSGKAKRIRNNGRVRVAPCDVRGKVLGEWIDARAEIVTGADAEHGMQLLNKKYMPWKQLLDFFSIFSRNKRVVFLIRPA
jgi:PPOX class probable F420-dependent enzyme